MIMAGRQTSCTVHGAGFQLSIFVDLVSLALGVLYKHQLHVLYSTGHLSVRALTCFELCIIVAYPK